jgi:nucleotide-diphospho-sugar transferase
MNKIACLWSATSGVAPLLLKSLISAREAGIDPGDMYVLHLDSGLADILQQEGVRTNPLQLTNDHRTGRAREFDLYHAFGTPQFNRICFVRYQAIHLLLESGFDAVLNVDADILFLENPLNDLAHQSHYAPDAILMQNDSGEWDGRRAAMIPAKGESVMTENLCPGFSLWRNRPEHKSFMIGIYNAGFEAEWVHSDQDVINSAKSGFVTEIQILPARKYPNGAYFVQFLDATFEARPFIFHANWVIGLERKLSLMDYVAQSRARSKARQAT